MRTFFLALALALFAAAGAVATAAAQEPVTPPTPDVTLVHPTPDLRPPPRVTSDVRVRRPDDGAWLVEWSDNSDDETRFDVMIWAEDVDGTQHGTVGAGTAPADATSLRLPATLPGLDPGCHRAHVIVFAYRGNIANGLSGNTTVTICNNSAGISFADTRLPDTGDGPAHRDSRPPAIFAALIALTVLGAATLAASSAARRT